MQQQTNIFAYSHIADYLKAVVRSACESDPTFTPRVWAKAMGLNSPSLLIAVLRKERRVSHRLASSLKQYLKLNEEEIKYFDALVIFSGPRAPIKEPSIIRYLEYLKQNIAHV